MSICSKKKSPIRSCYSFSHHLYSLGEYNPDAITAHTYSTVTGQSFYVTPTVEGKTLLSYAQALAWLTETHSRLLVLAVIPGNSSKCTIRSQQLFQIPAKKTPAAALSELRKRSKPAGSLLTVSCGQSSRPKGHFICGYFYHHTCPFPARSAL